MVTHFAVEPHAFAAAPDESGVTIWSPTQHPFVLQRVVAACLGCRWRACGSSRRIPAAASAARAGRSSSRSYMALRLGRPVRLVLTLEESFQAARRTSARIQASDRVRP